MGASAGIEMRTTRGRSVCTSMARPADVLNRAAYVGKLDGRATVYEQLIRPNYQGGVFNRTRSVNQYLTHWIYPYRGKYHPQMVRALLNIVGVRRGSRVLDPYVGSGTTALEASLLGIECVGVDISPSVRAADTGEDAVRRCLAAGSSPRSSVVGDRRVGPL